MKQVVQRSQKPLAQRRRRITLWPSELGGLLGMKAEYRDQHPAECVLQFIKRIDEKMPNSKLKAARAHAILHKTRIPPLALTKRERMSRHAKRAGASSKLLKMTRGTTQFREITTAVGVDRHLKEVNRMVREDSKQQHKKRKRAVELLNRVVVGGTGGGANKADADKIPVPEIEAAMKQLGATKQDMVSTASLKALDVRETKKQLVNFECLRAEAYKNIRCTAGTKREPITVQKLNRGDTRTCGKGKRVKGNNTRYYFHTLRSADLGWTHSHGVTITLCGKIDGYCDGRLIEIKNRINCFLGLKDYERIQIMCYLRMLKLEEATLVEQLSLKDGSVRMRETPSIKWDPSYWSTELLALGKVLAKALHVLDDPTLCSRFVVGEEILKTEWNEIKVPEL